MGAVVRYLLVVYSLVYDRNYIKPVVASLLRYLRYLNWDMMTVALGASQVQLLCFHLMHMTFFQKLYFLRSLGSYIEECTIYSR